MNIKDKCIVLTGAAGGIGAAIARSVAAQGARLILTGRDASKLNTLASSLAGGKHLVVVADLATTAGRERLVAVAKEHGADVLINNAGANQLALLPSMSDDQITQLININLSTPMLLCRDFIPLLAAKPEAMIINIGSILGSIGQAGASIYCASKAGLRGFTEALRRELADTHTKVIYVAPRATNTALNTDRMCAMNKELGTASDTPDVVAASVLAAILKANKHYWYIGSPEAFFVRLNYLLPALVDKALLKQLPIIKRYAKS